jgi:hypothetical protein
MARIKLNGALVMVAVKGFFNGTTIVPEVEKRLAALNRFAGCIRGAEVDLAEARSEWLARQ